MPRLRSRMNVLFDFRRSQLASSSERAREFGGFFSSVRRHLKPNGVLAFDVFNPSIPLLARPRSERFEMMRVDSRSYGELTVEATMDYDRDSQVNRATWFISTPNKRDAWVVPLHLRSIFPQELLALLATHGFRLARRDGDFAGAPFTSASMNQVCQCLVA